MYLFFRTVRLRPGSTHEQLSWALAMTEKVNQISENPVSLWAPFASPSVNSLTWTAAVEDLVQLEATTDKLMADSGYHMLLEQGSHHVEGMVDDGLVQIVHGPQTAPEGPPAYASAVDAVIAPGNFRRGLEVGIEIAERATRACGVPISLSIGTTGAYGRVTWGGGYESIEQLQRAGEALQADMSFTDYLDTDARDVYLPGATQTFVRRIA